ncbi:MAG: class I SAM-dependent methyltransferase [Anaerolineae bacterium]
MLLCRHCGLVFLAGIDRDHRKPYWQEYRYRLDEDGLCAEHEGRNEAVFRWITGNLPETEDLTLMEVGCNAGFLLKKFKDRGISVSGIEPNEEAVEFARHVNGIRDIECCMLEDAEGMERSQDVIILIQTFEHLADPLGSLSKVRRLLKEDGLLFVEVPNSYSPTGFYLLQSKGVRRPSPNHLFIYSSRTLGAFLARAGFSVRRRSRTLQNIRIVAEADGDGEDLRFESYYRALTYFYTLPIINRAIDVFSFFKGKLLRG